MHNLVSVIRHHSKSFVRKVIGQVAELELSFSYHYKNHYKTMDESFPDCAGFSEMIWAIFLIRINLGRKLGVGQELSQMMEGWPRRRTCSIPVFLFGTRDGFYPYHYVLCNLIGLISLNIPNRKHQNGKRFISFCIHFQKHMLNLTDS